ncbi:hypothetical protein MG293_010312 [Ovis ammon polii]|uniref:Uncharacterized protein n=1 Tax=Ovis ammon polii TaxID=230172 RepID=A0AAD4U807_OVIAM|nr:hypothetical protein MG293_010312 [Ovis ammon polii]
MWTNGPEVDKTWQGLEVLGDCCPGAAALESELVQDTRPQSPAGPPLEDRALATLRVRLQHRLSISLQVRKPDQSRFHRLIPDEPLGPSGAPCGLDPGRYPPSPCPQVLLPLYRLPAGRIEASSPRRRQQLLLQWPVSKGSTQQTTVGAVEDVVLLLVSCLPCKFSSGDLISSSHKSSTQTCFFSPVFDPDFSRGPSCKRLILRYFLPEAACPRRTHRHSASYVMPAIRVCIVRMPGSTTLTQPQQCRNTAYPAPLLLAPSSELGTN